MDIGHVYGLSKTFCFLIDFLKALFIAFEMQINNKAKIKLNSYHKCSMLLDIFLLRYTPKNMSMIPQFSLQRKQSEQHAISFYLIFLR